jgi:hypothetical protein
VKTDVISKCLEYCELFNVPELYEGLDKPSGVSDIYS